MLHELTERASDVLAELDRGRGPVNSGRRAQACDVLVDNLAAAALTALRVVNSAPYGLRQSVLRELARLTAAPDTGDTPAGPSDPAGWLADTLAALGAPVPWNTAPGLDVGAILSANGRVAAVAALPAPHQIHDGLLSGIVAQLVNTAAARETAPRPPAGTDDGAAAGGWFSEWLSARLYHAGNPLPWTTGDRENTGSIFDADGNEVAVVDPNNLQLAGVVENIACDIVSAVNRAGGCPDLDREDAAAVDAVLSAPATV
ncbi:hypothetical protein [Thalassobaculum sp.]|uniref:hypothetical protein n=1 Tax=Thalassobaculum sp. TaxID=2022740 RepID=UPI0032EDAC56